MTLIGRWRSATTATTAAQGASSKGRKLSRRAPPLKYLSPSATEHPPKPTHQREENNQQDGNDGHRNHPSLPVARVKVPAFRSRTHRATSSDKTESRRRQHPSVVSPTLLYIWRFCS